MEEVTEGFKDTMVVVVVMKVVKEGKKEGSTRGRNQGHDEGWMFLAEISAVRSGLSKKH